MLLIELRTFFCLWRPVFFILSLLSLLVLPLCLPVRSAAVLAGPLAAAASAEPPAAPFEHQPGSPASGQSGPAPAVVTAAEKSFDDLIHVPPVRQATAYTCGVAALQSLLAYYGDEFREGSLAGKLKAGPVHGTSYHRIERFAQARGYQVQVLRDLSLADLESLLERRTPVLVLLQAWADRKTDYATDWDDGHYVVAIGYDSANIYFMDPSTIGCYTFVPVKEFLQRWHDTDGKERLVHFGMVIGGKSPNFSYREIKYME